ncbi:MAG: hypothetical protein ACYTXA_32750 [Nostoc sp.]
MGGAERNSTDYQDVGLRKASTQPTIFLQHFSLDCLFPMPNTSLREAAPTTPLSTSQYKCPMPPTSSLYDANTF